MRPLRPAVPPVLALLVLLAGCRSSADTAPSGTTAADTAPSGTTAIAQPAVAVAVTELGAAPRTTLRRTAGQGGTQHVTLITTASVRQTVGAAPQQDLSTPELTLPLAATGTSSAGASKASASNAVALVLGIPTATAPILTRALTAVAGSRAGLTVQPSGAVDELRITPAGGGDDSARAAVEQALRQAVQLTPVLPSVPVGVGAVWTATEVVDSLGLQIDQVTTTTLTAVHGSELTLTETITQTPETSSWTLPNEGGTLNVDAYPMTGTGTFTVDTSAPLPLAGSISLGGAQVFSDPASGLLLRQDVRSSVTWTR